MSWLPAPPPATPTGTLRPWKAPSLPRGLKTNQRLQQLTYVVVDEVIEGVAGLSLAPWPDADSKGRLRFRIEDDPTHVVVDVDDLCEFLQGRGLPFFPAKEAARDEEKRGLLIGTTFAAEVKQKPRPSARWPKRLDRYLGEIHDISADARDLAKLALYGALTEIWADERADRLGLVKESKNQGG